MLLSPCCFLLACLIIIIIIITERHKQHLVQGLQGLIAVLYFWFEVVLHSVRNVLSRLQFMLTSNCFVSSYLRRPYTQLST